MNSVIQEEILNIHSLEELVRALKNALKRASGADLIILYARETESETLKPISYDEENDESISAIPVDETTFPGWCALHAETISSNNPLHDSKALLRENHTTVPYRNLCAAPLLHYGRVMGVVLTADNRNGFTKDITKEIELILAYYTPHFEFFLQKEDLNDLTSKYEDLVIRTTDMVTPEATGHVLRVASLALEMANLLDMSELTRRRLWQAALFHDIGKILLVSRDPWEIEQLHTREGADYLRSIKALKNITTLVETSHERYDGTGFPSGLGEDAVPLEGWVLALAEDLEEHFQQNRTMLPDDILRSFYRYRAESHHPLVIEALSALVDAGKLERVMGR